MKCYKAYWVLLLFSVLSYPALSQLTVNPGQTAATLAAKLAGPGVTIISPVLTCASAGNGTFVSVSTPLAIDSGIILSSGKAVQASGLESFLASSNNGTAGDAALSAVIGTTTRDACVLEFDFVSTGDTIKFNYQFGSEEYNHSTCGQYNDPFAFFISGPGIVGTQNMALVPGTNVPVAVNSVNSGVPGSISLCPTCNISNCTSMGAGSPFTAYFYDNAGGTQLSYKGFTTKFTAVHDVIPCNTYHLKMAVCDASNNLYDSGVFLEAGSLKTNSYNFSRIDSAGATINGIPHTIVKGCNPATVKIQAAYANTTDGVIHFSFGGTAINGVDVSTVADSVILPADSTSVSVDIQAIATPPTGTKTFKLFIQAGCGITDSITLNVLDTPTASIITPDTTICYGSSFQIRTTGSAGLDYNWAPASSLSSSTVMQPFAVPMAYTVYTMTATLTAAGCLPITRHFSVSIDTVRYAILTPDTSICLSQSVPVRVDGGDTLTYSWAPGAELSDSHIKNPVARPTATTLYTLTVTSPRGCTASSTLRIAIVNVSVDILNPDTAMCIGGTVQIRTNGDPSLHYQWLPTAGIAASRSLNPLITPDTSATYYLIGNFPGCRMIFDSIRIDVQPHPYAYIGGTLAVCSNDTLHLHAIVTPSWYSHYMYRWQGNVDDTTAADVVYTPGNTFLVLNVTTPAGCSSVDSEGVIMHPVTTDSLRDTVLCPGDSVQLQVGSGKASYHWYPAMYLSDSLSRTPMLHAITTQHYIMIATDKYGCKDTADFNITMRPAAVIFLGDSVTLRPGESYQIPAQTNCTRFQWFPPSGLNDAHISNPTAAPEFSTRYVVVAENASGCVIKDSIDINVDIETLLTVPNAFAPGNGPNGYLKIIRKGIANLNYFRIFNRWGNMVYESQSIDGGWDGTYNGTPQPVGVFVYEIEAVTSTGATYHKHGNVTLIR